MMEKLPRKKKKRIKGTLILLNLSSIPQGYSIPDLIYVMRKRGLLLYDASLGDKPQIMRGNGKTNHLVVKNVGDLKQILDSKVEALSNTDFFTHFHIEPLTLTEKLKLVKENNKYPSETNAHNALDDAKWNFELYKFLQTI